MAAQIAKDMVSDAKNYSIRLNDSAHFEEQLVRMFIAKFTALNVNLKHAMPMPTNGVKMRQKRNIIGNVLSSLTGLVTYEGETVSVGARPVPPRPPPPHCSWRMIRILGLGVIPLGAENTPVSSAG